MLKLAKLPDRTPAKITITVGAELNQALCDYQKAYEAIYGVSEKVADLIPFILEAFLESDRAFSKARKAGLPGSSMEEPARRRRLPRGGGAVSPSTPDTED